MKRAQQLPTADVVGSSDAFVELTTDGKHIESTRVIPDSLTPVSATFMCSLCVKDEEEEEEVRKEDKEEGERRRRRREK